MNNSFIHQDSLFTVSGCLTGDALTQFVKGTLRGESLTMVQQHLDDCSLCADAAEGLRIWLNDTTKQQQSAVGQTMSADLLRTETEKLNKRVKQRLQALTKAEPVERKRILNKTYAWIAAAAALLLFMSGFYVLWVRNPLGSSEMARKAEWDSILRTYIYDTLPQPPPASETVLAVIKEVNIKGRAIPPQVSIVSKDDARVIAINNATYGNADDFDVQRIKQTYGYSAAKEEAGVSEEYRNYQSTAARQSGGAAKRSETEDDSRAVLSFADEMPSFPGGDSQRLRFLKKHIRYPGQASENEIQGIVFVSFVVKKSGNLSDVKILKGIGGGCDQEAMRVVKLMPRWNPGYQNGRKVDVRFTMPVYFKLQ